MLPEADTFERVTDDTSAIGPGHFDDLDGNQGKWELSVGWTDIPFLVNMSLRTS